LLLLDPGRPIWGEFLPYRFWAAELGKRPFRWPPHFDSNAPHFSRLGRLDEFPNAAVRTCPVERRNRGGLWTGCFWASQL